MIYKCPNCGRISKEKVQSCSGCGFSFNYERIITPKSVSKIKNHKTFDNLVLFFQITNLLLSLLIFCFALYLPFYNGEVPTDYGNVPVNFSMLDLFVYCFVKSSYTIIYPLLVRLPFFAMALVMLIYEFIDFCNSISKKRNMRKISIWRSILYKSLLIIPVTLPLILKPIEMLASISLNFVFDLSYISVFYTFYKTMNAGLVVFFIITVIIYIVLLIVEKNIRNKRRIKCLKESIK